MFSKQDYIDYFLEIKKLEIAMSRKFKEYGEAITDNELKNTFNRLSKEELAHAKIADSLLELFDYEPVENKK